MLFAGPESEILPSWFEFFNKELVRTLSFSDHEAFDHPVACKLWKCLIYFSFFKKILQCSANLYPSAYGILLNVHWADDIAFSFWFVLCPKLFAGLLAVSSKDEEPINRFVDLFNTNKLPSLLNDGTMDPKILKHYLLVHDNQDSASEKYATLSFLAILNYQVQ